MVPRPNASSYRLQVTTKALGNSGEDHRRERRLRWNPKHRPAYVTGSFMPQTHGAALPGRRNAPVMQPCRAPFRTLRIRL